MSSTYETDATGQDELNALYAQWVLCNYALIYDPHSPRLMREVDDAWDAYYEAKHRDDIQNTDGD